MATVSLVQQGAHKYFDGSFTAAGDLTAATSFPCKKFKVSVSGSWTGTVSLQSRKPAFEGVAAGSWRVQKTFAPADLAEAVVVEVTSPNEEWKLEADVGFSGTANVLVSGGPVRE